VSAPDETERRTLREAGRKYAAMREVVDLRCAACGRQTSGMKTKRYCSDVCRVRASRDRAKQHVTDRAEVSARLARAIEEFDRIRTSISAGRIFEDSADLVRRERELRSEELMRQVRGEP
jgi:hypothetical protein